MSIKVLLEPNTQDQDWSNIYCNNVSSNNIVVENLDVINNGGCDLWNLQVDNDAIIGGNNFNPTNGVGSPTYVLSTDGAGNTTWVSNLAGETGATGETGAVGPTGPNGVVSPLTGNLDAGGFNIENIEDAEAKTYFIKDSILGTKTYNLQSVNNQFQLYNGSGNIQMRVVDNNNVEIVNDLNTFGQARIGGAISTTELNINTGILTPLKAKITAGTGGAITITDINGDDVAKIGGFLNQFNYSGDNATPVFISARKTRGTPALPTAILNGDAIRLDYALGHDGVGLNVGVQRFVRATENWSVGNNGSSYSIQTCNNGSSTEIERLLINTAGTTIKTDLFVNGLATFNFGVNSFTLPLNNGNENEVLTMINGTGQSVWKGAKETFTLLFGGNMGNAPERLWANGDYNLNTNDIHQVGNRFVIPKSCSITRIAYDTTNGDATTIFEILLNNVSQGTFNLLPGPAGVINLGIFCNAGDFVGIRHTNGATCNNTIASLYCEIN